MGKKPEAVESCGSSTRSARSEISARERSLLARRTALMCAGMRLMKMDFFIPDPASSPGSRSCMSRKSCEGRRSPSGPRATNLRIRCSSEREVRLMRVALRFVLLHHQREYHG